MEYTWDEVGVCGPEVEILITMLMFTENRRHYDNAS